MDERPPSALRRLVVAPLVAGLLGSGVGLWIVGLGVALHEQRVVPGSEDTVLYVAVPVSLGAALGLGYTAGVQSYPALVVRLVGSLFFGLLAAALGIYVVAGVVFHNAGEATITAAIAILGALVAGVVAARLHGARLRAFAAGSPYRAGAVAAVAVMVTWWPLSPRLRCTLWSGAGCRLAARIAADGGDEGFADDLLQRGCSLDDARACRLAGERLRGRDPGRAEALLGDGCALGDDAACGGVHAALLAKRCAGYSASACRDLAEAYRRGDGVATDLPASTSLFHKACLLGDQEACGR